MIRLWRTVWFERTPPTEQVDFGNGQIVSADDILDGHFQQLTAHNGHHPSTHQVSPEQVQQERQTKIEQVAPQLSPLTDLAEQVAETLPDAQPTTHFRATLNKALTETHRQHNAQRTIGIRPTPTDASEWTNLLILGLILVILTMGVAGYGQWLNESEKNGSKNASK